MRVHISIVDDVPPRLVYIERTRWDEVPVEREHPSVRELEEAMYAELAARGPVRMPSGELRVIADADEYGRRLTPAACGRLLARRIAGR